VVRTLRRLRPGGFADYLVQRYANPSFVASMALMGLLEDVEQRASGNGALVLDLGCGTGHSTAMMQRMFPGLRYVAADPDFVNLQIMRQHFVDDNVMLVCVDAELPLPFADEQFAAVFCLDTFHYIRSKAALGAELGRVMQPGGSWLFAHLHNRAATNPAAGLPLTAEGYRRVLGRADALVLSEEAILHALFVDGTFDPPGIIAGNADAAFSLVSGPCRRARHYDVAGGLVAMDRSGLDVNPIYQATSEGSGTVLTQQWPNAGLRAECAAMAQLLPTVLRIPAGLTQRARAGTLDPGEEELVAELIRKFVLVHLPPGYLGS
jgi:SAM-dependent methyltransferase